MVAYYLYFYFDKRRKKRNCWKEFKKWSSQAKKHIFLVLSMDSWSCKKNVGHKWENNMERKSFCSCSALCVQFFFSPGPKSQQVKSINIHHYRGQIKKGVKRAGAYTTFSYNKGERRGLQIWSLWVWKNLTFLLNQTGLSPFVSFLLF